MTRAAIRAKELYHSSPEARARVLARNMAYQERNKKDPEFTRLTLLRKRICKVRKSYQDRLAHAERLFKRLERLLKLRDKFAA